jgi:hypothetical protein
MKRWPFPAETMTATAFIDQNGELDEWNDGIMGK